MMHLVSSFSREQIDLGSCLPNDLLSVLVVVRYLRLPTLHQGLMRSSNVFTKTDVVHDLRRSARDEVIPA